MKQPIILLAVHLGLFGAAAQPVITCQPTNQTALVGVTVTMSVCATGAPPLSYQWVFRTAGNLLPGATNDTLIISNVQSNHAGNYRVFVTNSAGSVQSSSALLTVVVPPLITQPPVSQGAEIGDAVALSVVVIGTPPLAFQWLFNSLTLAGQTGSNLTLINVQPSNTGPYSVAITNNWGAITSQVATITLVPPVFTQITNGAIANDGGHSVGCAWGDYDNDGFIDLFVTNNQEPQGDRLSRNRLYHNAGNGTFTAVTNGPTASDPANWRGASWADYDNDGLLDLFLTSVSETYGPARNLLFRNVGGGMFSNLPPAVVGDIAEGDPGGQVNGSSEGVAWSDYDNDGVLDLFIARYATDWTLRNDGSGFFTRITNNLAGTVVEDSYYASWSDYNNDGLSDLFVTVVGGPNRLYRNLGGGRFEQVRSGNIATDRAASFGCAWGDYDNDGWPDLYVANGYASALQTNFLYHNNGDGTFTRMTSNLVGSLVSDAGYGVTPTWADYDNDGWLDLFVTCGYGDSVPHSITVGNTNLLYHNNGDGTFRRVKSGRIAASYGQSIATAWGDYDNDGFLDLFVARGAHETMNNLLYHNNGNSNGWVRIKLIGTGSNRSGIGAKVRLQATIHGRTVWQLREITTGNGHNESPLEAHFGLGDATNIAAVRIEWPSGIRQEFHDLSARQIFTVTEPPLLLANHINGQPQFGIRGRRGDIYQVETSTNLADWAPLGLVTITNKTGTAIVSEGVDAEVGRKFYRAQSR